MKLCCDGHNEICYDSHYCPACDIREDLKNEIFALKEDVIDLNDQIKDLLERQSNG